MGLINRTIEYRNTDILLRLYKSLVRPHLEYCVPVYAPHYLKDKALIEIIQKIYQDDTVYSEIFLWETVNEIGSMDTSIRADLVEVYKMVYGLSSVRLNTFFWIFITRSDQRSFFEVEEKQISN